MKFHEIFDFSGKKGGGHANPNEFRCKFLGLPKKAQHCFPRGGWGDQRPFGSFPKIHRKSTMYSSLMTPQVATLEGHASPSRPGMELLLHE